MKLQQDGTWLGERRRTRMKLHHTLLGLAAAVLLSPGGAIAAEPSSARPQGAVIGDQIYQQRLPDGRVVLTDRPMEGAPVQRMWGVMREDPVAASRRSEQVRQEAQAVSERIERRIEGQQRQLEQSEADRLRLRLAEARREAEAQRQASARTAVVYVPRPVPVIAPDRAHSGSIEWSDTPRGRFPVSRSAAADRPGATPVVPTTPVKKPSRRFSEGS